MRLRRSPVLALLVAGMLVACGCGGHHRGARTLGGLGAVLAVGGGATWVVGERRDQRALTNAGVVSTAVGIALLVAAGGWMAASVSCESDPDCPENQHCREIPPPPGGGPYKQCVPQE